MVQNVPWLIYKNRKIMTKTDETYSKQFQIEVLTKQLVEMLMTDRNLSMEQALDMVYKSKTYQKIENEHTGLYYQSPVYILDMLLNE